MHGGKQAALDVRHKDMRQRISIFKLIYKDIKVFGSYFRVVQIMQEIYQSHKTYINYIQICLG